MRENAGGAIELRYRGRLMRWAEIPTPPRRPTAPPAVRPAVAQQKLDKRIAIGADASIRITNQVGTTRVTGWDRDSIAGVPRFPSVRRDFSLLLNRSTRYADVERAVRMPAIPELVRVEPFDRLETGPFPESKYALAISLMYQSPERTLTDEEVETFDKRILDSLRKQLGAELRQ